MKYAVTPDACRICLRRSRSCRSLFKPNESDIPPFEKLKLVCGVNVIQNDKDFPALPQLICRTCEISLNMAFTLRSRARKSDQVIHIYCNKMNKDNIIVELNTGRKFKLSKELTLKVVRKNKTSSPVDIVDIEDDPDIDVGENVDESYLDREIKHDDEIKEIIDNNMLPQEEDFHEVKEGIPPKIVEYLDSSDNDDDNHGDSKSTDDDEDDEEEEEQDVKPTQLYNAAEIAKRLEASDKYHVVSWKQDDKSDSVPIFRLRRKGLETKQPTDDFICEICGNTYRQRHRLTEHMRRHNNERSYECEICNKRFAVAEGLRRHVLTHGGQKPFKCSYCSRRFYNQSSRKAHEIVHSGAKPYVCNICDRPFAYTCSLRKHMLIHENIKLYRCGFCDKEFRLQHHLKQHEETQIHKDAMEEYLNDQLHSVLK